MGNLVYDGWSFHDTFRSIRFYKSDDSAEIKYTIRIHIYKYGL